MENNKREDRKKILSFIGILIVAFIIGGSFISKNQDKESKILSEIRNKNGYIRTVDREEYEFFQNLVSRDNGENLSNEELDEKTKEKINRTNAEFLLGNQMGLCKPYSFVGLKMDMANENTQRRLKKEEKEVFYGPEQFDLITYYIYISGNLKLDMVSFIKSNADKDIEDGAKSYFNENREKYRTIEKIEYLLSENGKTVEKELIREDMSIMEKTDSQLFEFLYSEKEGAELKYVYQGKSRTAKIVSVKYEKLNYKNNAERVMRDYITNIYLENWIQEIEENSPVEFEI